MINFKISDRQHVQKISVKITVTSQDIASLNFQQGVNFISIPLSLGNSSIISIFSGNLDKIRAIYSYNQGWKAYYPTKPELSSLSYLENNKGYVVIANSAFIQQLTGSQLSNNFNLVSGWNLIGISQNITLSNINGYTAAFEYNNGYQQLTQSSNLLSGKSYWIYK